MYLRNLSSKIAVSLDLFRKSGPGYRRIVVMMDALESRVLFSTINTSSVSLYNANGTPGAKIDKHMALFVLVHGDNMNPSMMTDMAAAVEDELPANEYQVLILDWSQLASAPQLAAKVGLAVGDALAGMIKASRIPVSRVNLIGFSMGGTVIGRAAKDLKTNTSEVNRIIGVDPSAGYYEPADYAQDSAYSIAFCGDDTYGGTVGSLSADDAILLTGLSSNDLDRHSDVFQTVTTIWQNDAGLSSDGDAAVSSLFSIQSILNGSPPNWRKNSEDGGFVAVMACNDTGGDPSPISLTYINSRNHTITVE
jgi:pimeloyl-ACP methyl ester carboxylesterase